MGESKKVFMLNHKGNDDELRNESECAIVMKKEKCCSEGGHM